MPRHDVTSRIAPPTVGARIGASGMIAPSVAYSRAASTPEYMSRTIARAITIPVAPAMPCSSRRMSSTAIDGAAAHPSDEAMNSTSPASSGRRRPSVSLSGPTSS